MSSGSSRPPTMRSTATPMARSSWSPPAAGTSRWPVQFLQRLERTTERVKAGVVTSEEVHQARHMQDAIEGHIRDYVSTLTGSEDHRGKTEPVPGATEGHPGVAKPGGSPPRRPRALAGPPDQRGAVGPGLQRVPDRGVGTVHLAGERQTAGHQPVRPDAEVRRGGGRTGARDGLSRWTSSAGSRRPPGPHPGVRSARPARSPSGQPRSSQAPSVPSCTSSWWGPASGSAN